MKINLLIFFLCHFCLFVFAQDTEESQEEIFIINNRKPIELNFLQTVDKSGVFILQSGVYNTTDINVITYENPSLVTLNQRGSGNNATMNVYSSDSKIGVLQLGNYNDFQLNLQFDQQSNMTFSQVGNENNIDFDINYTYRNNVNLLQSGNENELIIETDNIGIPGMTISQYGNGASLIIKE